MVVSIVITSAILAFLYKRMKQDWEASKAATETTHTSDPEPA
jgi:hypothetical protein